MVAHEVLFYLVEIFSSDVKLLLEITFQLVQKNLLFFGNEIFYNFIVFFFRLVVQNPLVDFQFFVGRSLFGVVWKECLQQSPQFTRNFSDAFENIPKFFFIFNKSFIVFIIHISLLERIAFKNENEKNYSQREVVYFFPIQIFQFKS